MAWITHNYENYKLETWKVQCLKCDDILQGWDGSCNCGLIIVKDGRRVWPYFPVKDVSIWKSATGKVLPQSVVDHYFLRKSNKTSTDTETSTSTS